MSASDGVPTASSARAIRLHYVLTSEEASRVLGQVAILRENKLLHRAVIAGGACMAIHCATIGFWSGVAVFGTATIASLTRYSAQNSVIKFVFRGEAEHDLLVDSAGIRGTLECRLRIKRWSTTTQVEYRWPQLKSVKWLEEYLWLEFRSPNLRALIVPGGAIIPLEAFATPDDLQQFEAWAESGLAQGRTKPA